MSEEEAIATMENLKHGFFLFVNEDSNQYNMVYKRPNDPGYGIVKTKGAGKTKGPKGKSKGRFAKNNYLKITGTGAGGGKFKTQRWTKEGKEICKPFNDARTCTNPRCQQEHVCDIMSASGAACGSNTHSRENHTGQKIPL